MVENAECCGAKISANELILLPVRRTGAAFVALSEKAKKLRLENHTDQASIQIFSSSLQAYARIHGVKFIAVMGRAGRGQYAGGAVGFKIEAIVQLLDKIKVKIIAPTTISSRLKKNSIQIPDDIHKYQYDSFRVACAAMIS